ncbi:MAG: glycosyltransferase family 9 protein, partial [Prosthecobacter sp.]|nr:glycosyltransferase family 9 protein [Prosthecobacter sp.]
MSQLGVSQPPPRVLYLRGGALGDFILTLPVIRRLRQALPQARLEVMGQRGTVELALKAGLADAVRPLGEARMAPFFAKSGQIDPALAADIGGCTLVISHLHDPDGILRENMRRVGVQTFLQAPHQVLAGQGHACQQLARPLEQLAVSLQDADWRAPLFVCQNGLPPAVKRVAIHPGSGSLKKNWPMVRWLAVAQALQAHDPRLELVFLSGEAEEERGTLPADLPFPRWHGVPLTELVDRLAGCTLYLGHDSGVGHLAAACGLRCLLLFG